MPLVNDGDIIKGLGFVALYAAYLEEQIDALLFVLQPVEPYPDLVSNESPVAHPMSQLAATMKLPLMEHYRGTEPDPVPGRLVAAGVLPTFRHRGAV